mgnify:CR=1 FL=1
MMPTIQAQASGLIDSNDTVERVQSNTEWNRSYSHAPSSGNKPVSGLIAVSDSPPEHAAAWGGNARSALRLIINYVLFFLGILSTLGVIIGFPLGLYLFISGSRDERRKQETQPSQTLQDPEEMVE